LSAQREPSRQINIPPPQRNYQRAAELAFERLAWQSAEQLVFLGAAAQGKQWCLPVLNSLFEVDIEGRRITTGGRDVGLAWTVLALHYLDVRARPERMAPQVTFADLPTARSYASVYDQRVIARLCATAGRTAAGLEQAAQSLGAHSAQGGDLAFDFDVFPRLCLRLIWHAPDEEFPPSATLLLPQNIEEFFCAEDVVVLSERLVARLGGRLS